MTTIVTRAGKGSPLTHTEVDTNFTNLNTAKLETAAIPLGTLAAPSISFTGDANTGIYSPGADTLAFVTAGSNRLHIDSSGRLLVGTSSARTNVYYTTVATTPSVQFETSGSIYNGLSLINYSASGYSPVLTLGLSASNTPGTNTAIASNHEMGSINFVGNDGTNFRTGASIVATNDQASAWAVGDCPTRLVFSTTPDGAANPTERVRITSTGQVRLAGAGITFNGDTAAANELDDYEEGTWTPTVRGSVTAGTGTYSIQQGSYVKIGKSVTVSFRCLWTNLTGSSGTLMLANLPFTIDNANVAFCMIPIGSQDLTYTPSLTLVAGWGATGATYAAFDICTCTAAGAVSTLAVDTSADLLGTITFIATT